MKQKFFGNEMDKMPGWAFRTMSFMFCIVDLFRNPDNKLQGMDIRKGMTVVDYGSGTGRYLKKASELVGEGGTVYAVDIQELAVEAAFKMIRKHNLSNIKPLKTDGNTTDVPSGCADLIYALDMFHMVRNTFVFLKELQRICKDDGRLVIEDGHQPRSLSREKILQSGCWEIVEERKGHLICRPQKQK
jgi:ubiquinone/menaquinone biosynthesis C-methylase UbiE